MFVPEKAKTNKKSVTLRIDQIRWLEKQSGGRASFSATLQAAVDIVMKGQGICP